MLGDIPPPEDEDAGRKMTSPWRSERVICFRVCFFLFFFVFFCFFFVQIFVKREERKRKRSTTVLAKFLKQKKKI